MRIAVIGAGAMGSIYGGHLSLHNDVYLVDTNPNVVAAVNENGLKLQEYGTDNLYHPKAVTSTEGLEPVDLIILFVKALFSKAALAGNKALIGPDTYVLTLQNGSSFEGTFSGEITNAKGGTVSTGIGTVNVVLDSTSTWTLTADTYITTFEGSMEKVVTGGYTLYVNGIAMN